MGLHLFFNTASYVRIKFLRVLAYFLIKLYFVLSSERLWCSVDKRVIKFLHPTPAQHRPESIGLAVTWSWLEQRRRMWGLETGFCRLGKRIYQMFLPCRPQQPYSWLSAWQRTSLSAVPFQPFLHQHPNGPFHVKPVAERSIPCSTFNVTDVQILCNVGLNNQLVEFQWGLLGSDLFDRRQEGRWVTQTTDPHNFRNFQRISSPGVKLFDSHAHVPQPST